MMSTSSVRPDHITFPFLLKYCCSIRNLISSESVHAHVLKFGVGVDLFVQNGMISMYSSFGSIQSALKVFTGMPEKDIVSWNSILIGSLRCGDLDLALGLFDEMKQDNNRNIVSWNSIMTGLVQAGRPKDALIFFHEMFDSDGGGVLPDKITISVVICACAALGALDHGRWMHNYMKRRNELEIDTVLGTALVDMYGKCGCVERASNVFDDIPNKDVLAWTAMISAFAVNGHGEEAFALFSEMEKHGIRPNQVTYGALLNACAHSGLLIKGRQSFRTMKDVYGIVPNLQHYACMVDLLSRAGLFEEALELIRTMPIKPDVYVFGALLGGCRMHGNAELGEELAEYLINLDPRNHVFYVILSDIYAKGNKFSNVKRIREFMSENGINKTLPGCSMIEINGIVHEFSVNGYDGSEVSSNEIGFMSNLIHDQLRCVKPSGADNDQVTGI